jgi:hypothetical protein
LRGKRNIWGIILIISILFSFLLQYKVNDINGILHTLRLQESTVWSTLTIIGQKVQHYCLTNGEYPVELSEDDFAQYGFKITDPWDNKYIYESNGKTFKLLSVGPDRIKGTKDDFVIGHTELVITPKDIKEWRILEEKTDFLLKRKLIRMIQVGNMMIFILFVLVIWSAWSFILTFSLKLRWQILVIVGIIFIFSLPAIFLPRW